MPLESELYIELYAIISSIEDDLTDVLASVPAKTLWAAIDAKTTPSSTSHEIALSLTFGKKSKVLNYLKERGAIASPKRVPKLINGLVDVRNRVFHRRPLEYGDQQLVYEALSYLKSVTQPPFISTTHTHSRLHEDKRAFLKTISIDYTNEDVCFNNLPTPDFQETGYIGRTSLRSQLVGALLEGNYPAITLVGEGGIGKTALALRSAWDVVDHPSNPFEAVIWTTAKQTQLVGFSIEEIKSDIRSGIDVFEAAASTMGDTSDTTSAEMLMTMLREFSCLLIIDNLETVLDPNIRELAQSVPSGSKILFTSRVTLGEGDRPFRMPHLNDDDARSLFRAFATVAALEEVADLPNNAIDPILKQLQYNPLFIKWYLQARKSGVSHAEIMSKRDTIIDFCMLNVFDDLSGDTKKLAAAFAATKPPHDVQKLSFVSELVGDRFEDSIRDLLRRNILQPKYLSESVTYEMGVLPKSFLSKSNILPGTLVRNVKKRENQYIDLLESKPISAAISYDPREVYLNDPANLISFKKLKSAGTYIARQDFKTALARAEDARALNPQYFEIYRIIAFCQMKSDLYFEANENYLTAIKLAPKHAPLRFFYANFLTEYNDLQDAQNQCAECLTLDPDSLEAQLLLSRILTYQNRFSEAYEILKTINASQISMRLRVIYCDRTVDALCRWLDKSYSEENTDEAKSIIGLIATTIADNQAFIDQRIRYKLSKIYRPLQFVNANSTSDDICKKHIEFINSQSTRHNIIQPEHSNDDASQNELGRKCGKISSIQATYGFIVSGDESLFFHRGEFVGKDFESLQVGVSVNFAMGANREGPCAIRVREHTI